MENVMLKISILLCILLVVHGKEGNLIKINEDNWSDMLTGEWMVEFYAPWCPACKSLEPEWENFASWTGELNLKVASVDVTTNPGLSGRFMVTALPTIYHVKDGIFRQYGGVRNSNSFVAFVEEKKYEKIEPVSSWKSPNSYQMSMVSYFFKISMALRAVHNKLVEEHGIPYWGSYILFAFVTIFLGALLGLIIVCVIDTFFPAKSFESMSKAPNLPSGKDTGDIIEEEDEETEEVRQQKLESEREEGKEIPPETKKDQ